MDQYIEHASNVVDRMAVFPIPQFVLQNCAGLVLIEAKEVGLAISGTSGQGVLLKKNDDKWSAPVAIKLGGAGVGGVVGIAKKSIVVVLNPLAMDKFIAGSFKLKLGEDIGFAVGPLGESEGADVGVNPETFNWGTSLLYAAQEGAMLNAEVTGMGITVEDHPNESLYGTKDVKFILDGTAKAPKGSKVPDFQKKVAEWCEKTAVL